MLKQIYSILTVVLFCSFLTKAAAAKPTPAGGDTVYVDLNATGSGNGTTWANAYTDLQNAITTEPVDKIFLVAKGTYYPSNTTNQYATFNLKSGHQLWGGFNNGDLFHQRNVKLNETILSGDLNKDGFHSPTLDANNIVFIDNIATARVDGFTITGAVNIGADGGAVIIQNSLATICNNKIINSIADNGGGIWSSSITQTPVFYNNFLKGDSAIAFASGDYVGNGGAIFINGDATLYNNVITASFGGYGGGVYALIGGGHTLTFINNTVAHNLGNIRGLVYEKNGGTAIFRNSIFWANEFDQATPPSYTSADLVDVFNCLSTENNLIGQGNLYNIDPKFTNVTVDDFSPQKCSPVLEKGNNSYFTFTPSIDFLGKARLFDGNYDMISTIDIGAIESDIVCEACTTDAGKDSLICALTVTLGAKKAGFQRVGKWTQISSTTGGTSTFSFDTLETATVTASKAGVYIYRWTLTGSDCSISDDVKITFYAQPVANAGADASICGKNYTMNATASVGSGIWSSVETGAAFNTNTNPKTPVSVTANGTYHFVWTETNGVCAISRDTVQIKFLPSPTPNAGNDTTVCGLSAGLKAINSLPTGTWTQVSGPGGGASGFNDNTSPTATVTATVYGSYVYRWTENNGSCPAQSDVVTVMFKRQPLADAGVNIDTCGNRAQLRAIPSAGTGTWRKIQGGGQVTFNPSANSATATMTVPANQLGQYLMEWKEDNGSACATSAENIFVNFSSSTVVDMQYIENKYCDPKDTIKFKIQMNGTPPFKFVVESPYRRDSIVTSNTIYTYSDSGVTKGASQVNFQITKFIDGNGCPGAFTNSIITIARRGDDLIPVGDGFSVNNDTLCNTNNAILSFNYSNTYDMVFSVEDVAKNNTFTVNYAGGIVNVPVTDLKYGVNKFRIYSTIKVVGGCEMGRGSGGVFEINIVYKPVKFDLVLQNLTCFESKDGSLQMTNLLSTSDLSTVTLNAIANASLKNTQYVSGLAAGQYTVYAKNNAGCEFSKSATLSQPSKITYNYTVKNPTCYNGNNGSVEIQTTGGSGTLLIHYRGATEPGPFKFLNQTAGTFAVRISDSNSGCSLNADSVKITQPDSLTIYTNAVGVNCDGSEFGNITIEPQGGTSPYSAYVTLGSYSKYFAPFPTSVTADNLKMGVYTIKVVDGKGCITTVKDTVKEGIELSFKAEKTKDADCATGGTITITTPSDIPGTKYSIDGTNYYTDTVFKNLPAGDYFVSARNPQGCVRTFKITIVDKTETFTATAAVTKSITCNQGSDAKITISPRGGSGNFRVVLNGGTPVKDTVFSNLGPGLYTFQVVDLTCAVLIKIEVTLQSPSTYEVEVSDSISPRCSYSADGAARVTPLGGYPGNYTYSLDNGATYQGGSQFTNLKAGTYQALTKDSKGCISKPRSFKLTAPDSLKITVANLSNEDELTRTSDITLAVSGGTPGPFGYDYSIDNGLNFKNDGFFEKVSWNYIKAVIKDKNNCRIDSTLRLGDTRIADLDAASSFRLYPNPGRGIITIDNLSAAQIENVVVMNNIGQVVFKADKTALVENKIDLGHVGAGMYQVMIQTTKGIAVSSLELLK